MTTPFNKRNSFDLSSDRLLTLDMGQFVPVKTLEVLPGDTFTVDDVFFARLEAMIAPALVDIDLHVYHFFVPNRILMEEKLWESFITGGKDGNSTVVAPYMMSSTSGYALCSLADYLEIPTNVPNLKHSAFPIRAYNKIFNDWIRDENLIDEVPVSLDDGLDTTTSVELKNKTWEKDYFTSALPWPQRGDAATFPFVGDAPVKGSGMALGFTDGSTNAAIIQSSTAGAAWRASSYGVSIPARDTSGNAAFPDGTVVGVTTDGAKSGLVADLSKASPVTINAMRVAFQVQRFLEKQARGGARLVETVFNHFGVRIPDARLQRSEFLGGARLRFMISPVEQTSSTDSTSPQGNLAGRGTLNAGTKARTFSFVEHGYFMTIVAAMPRTIYAQGLPRMYSRDSRYDYYWPVFAHLGEQEVRNKEIYAQGTEADDGIFGYQDRGSEYRHIPSSVAGLFRPGGSLEFWTLMRKFDSLPQLNGDFVTANPSKRIFAVQTQNNSIIMQYKQRVRAFRPLPKYGTPGLIDHD